MLNSKKILFLGCGKMGSILVNNLIENVYKSSQITAIDPSVKNKIKGVKYFAQIAALPKSYQADIVFLAIKPQNAKEILQEFARSKKFHKDTIFISILAGKKLDFFADILGDGTKIVRTMPNLPIEESQGVLAYILNKNLNNKDAVYLQKIFANFGEIIKLEKEELFDAFTAIFGSGPAYIFLLQEIFTQIALHCGINSDKAAELTKKLFLGSALMSCNSELDFAALRESVTSKGGTTDAALQVLQKDDQLAALLVSAIKQAIHRSKELSDE